MANIAIFRINYKSDFILTLNSDAGWMTPFCIKFWTGAPSQAYFAGYDGTTYTHCAPVEGDPTKLVVQFDDHHLPIGDLKFQIGYHFTVADFPTSVEDEVINQASVIIEVNDAPAQVMLDLNGETAPEIEFSLPAYANEAQRIANEEQRIANETQRIGNEETRIQHEESRIAAEQTRQQNEQQRINQEQARVNEFAVLKRESEQATTDANNAAENARQKAQLAQDKATLAQAAAQLANDKAALAQAAAQLANNKAQLAADKAALAQAASQLCDEKASLAQQKATYAQQQGDYSKAQGDYAKEQGDYSKAQGDYSKEQGDYSKEQGDYAKDKGDICAADHQTAVADHQTATADHQTAAADHQTATTDHNQAGNDHTRAESDHTRAESDHAAVEVYADSLGAFDISAYHATGGVLAKYADLAAALGTNGANIPDALRKGGMSVKYVQSSDNKYVQARCMAQKFTTYVTQWQGVESKPTRYSHNLVESGGVERDLIYNAQEYTAHQKETARTNIGLSNIETKSSTGEESLKVATDEDKELVHIHKTLQTQNNITIKDDSNNDVLSVDKDGLHAKAIFYGTNDTNLEEKINEISGNDKDVVLILFMGQSNMAGRGVTSAAHPQDAPAVIEGAGYEFRAISDPTKLYPITKTFGNTEDNPNGINDNGRKTGGPVPSFVNAFYRVAHTTVIGVSASRGGSSITQWQPNTSYLNDTISRLQSAISYLTTNGYNIKAKYIVWCQGEKDGDIGMSKADYANYFNTMANTLFSEGIEKFFIIRIGKYNGSEQVSYDDIIDEQNILCKGNDNYIMATTVLASLKDKGLMKDAFHYYQEGYNIAGTYSGLHTANYFLFEKSDVMYDVMSDSLYFDSKSY